MARRKSRKKSTPKRAKAKAKSSVQQDVGQGVSTDQWPTHRAVMFRPDRMKYVRKIDRPKGCVFCAALEKGLGAESLLLYQGRLAMVVMNKYPYNAGHLLVLPIRHCGDFLALNDAELAEINACLQFATHTLTEVYAPNGFNIGLNLGGAAGAGIPDHLHYHLIPRWNGDTNFFPMIADTKVIVETLEQTFNRLLPYFSNYAKDAANNAADSGGDVG